MRAHLTRSDLDVCAPGAIEVSLKSTRGNSRLKPPNGSTVSINPFSDDSLRRFRSALVHVLSRDLGIDDRESMELATEFSRLLREGREDAMPAIARRLRESGIGSRWNQVLSQERPAALTSWLLPHCKGTVLDLLCGDGRVGEYLSMRGVQVTLAERLDSYSLDRKHAIPFIDFDGLESAENFLPAFSTVLLCTVLHHEVAPEGLLRLASTLCLTRLIIVENCLDRYCPVDCQLLMDLFFSRCLNSFSLPSEGNHATFSHWFSRLLPYGSMRLHEKRRSLPGIPLTHDLIVIDIE